VVDAGQCRYGRAEHARILAAEQRLEKRDCITAPGVPEERGGSALHVPARVVGERRELRNRGRAEPLDDRPGPPERRRLRLALQQRPERGGRRRADQRAALRERRLLALVEL